MHSIYPVILSGGMGSRLWPMSRSSSPKQFQPVDGVQGPSFLQSTALRHCGTGFHDPVVVANSGQVDMIVSQLGDIGLHPTIIGEPFGRNTGPAVLAAALHLHSTDPDAMILVLPSDHVIDGDLNETIAEAAFGAEEGRIVVLGVKPTYPETGYGYMTSGGVMNGHTRLHHVSAFVEKPNLLQAEALIQSDCAYWAAGISLMRADKIIAEFARLEPDTLAAVRLALRNADRQGPAIHLDATSFSHALAEPTERAIFERSNSIAMAPVTVGWNDVGAWSAIHAIGNQSDSGNVLSPNVLAVDTSNSLVRGFGRLIVVLGMEDVIIVDTPDALLVTNHKNAQQVKDVVATLKNDARIEVESHGRTEQSLRLDGIDRIVVACGKSIEPTGATPAGSVMTVAAGRATIMVDGRTLEAGAGDIFIVHSGETVRIANLSDGQLTLVAVRIDEPYNDQRHDARLALDCIDAQPKTSIQNDRRVA